MSAKAVPTAPHIAAIARALQQQRHAEAENLCRAAIAANAADADAWHLLALVRRATGDHANALLALGRSVELDPRNAEARSNHGQVLLTAGQPAEAHAEFTAALELAPQFRPARLALARLCNELGLFGDAATHARALVERDRNDAEAWSALGAALQGLGRSEEAVEALRTALRLAPGYATAHANLVASLVRDDRPEEALAEIEALARRAPLPAAARVSQAVALMQLDRYDDAERQFEALLRDEPGHVPALRALTQLRWVRGDADYLAALRAAATQATAAGSRAAPGLALAQADALRRAGDAGEAESIVRTLLARHGPAAEILTSLATLLHADGRLAEALSLSEQALAARPGDAAVVENRVALLLSAGEAARALELVEPRRAALPTDLRWIAYRIDIARLRAEDEFAPWYDCERLVRSYDIDPPRGHASLAGFLEAVRAVIHPRHWQQRQPLDQSLRGGTQTSRGLQHDPDPTVRELLATFAAPIEAYQRDVAAAGLLPPPLQPLMHAPGRLIGCWSVRLRRGGSHVNHFHPEGLISSAFYLTVPDEVADTGRRSGWIKFGEPRWPVPGLEPLRHVQPAPGRLVLFPSYLWHGTVPLVDDAPRVTVAFDAAPRIGAGRAQSGRRP